ncbi:MAG: DNA polymerase III subunit alpha, partial [Oscillospiraceae bacterium]|nr:DNA polymerase III subunit alpha [Oscillospiraceae bacterium]
KDPDFDINKIPIDDPEVYEMLSQGLTTGIFQFESAGIRQVLMRLKPESIEDIIAVLSLYRPGPMDSIPRYIECRHNPQKVTFKHPILKDILNVTYGCIVYQEQVMEICRKMAGYSYGRADLVRRAMAKKKTAEMLKERGIFVEGAAKNGVSTEIANEIFDEMESFASYAFNKSHAAAYAHVSYQTAYLKHYYFKEYMAALMSAFLESTGKILEYASECSKNGVKILSPDVNESGFGFSPAAKGIRFSLLAVKNLGYNSIRDLLDEREKGGAFKSLNDFCKRISGRDLNQRAIESLIKCGALDCFGYTRREMLENYDKIFGSVQRYSLSNMEGQINFFDTAEDNGDSFSFERLPEYPLAVKLEMEKEIMGAYLSGHPLEDYRPYAKLCGATDIARLYDELDPPKDGSEISSFCTLQGVKLYTQKNGAKMAFVTLEDMTGEAEGIIFADTLAANRDNITRGRSVHITAKLSYKDGDPKLIAEQIADAGQFVRTLEKASLYIRCRSDSSVMQDILNVCRDNPGDTKVIFYLSDLKKKLSPKAVAGVKISENFADIIAQIAGKDNIALK